MENFAKLLSAIAQLAWPIVVGVVLAKLFPTVKLIMESAKSRKFTVKVAGNELSMEEASRQQSDVITDLQSKVAALEVRTQSIDETATKIHKVEVRPKRILWVDDRPTNNSFLIASLQASGMEVTTATSTDGGISMFSSIAFDAVVSDMARPEGDKAGIELITAIRRLNESVPIFIFCGKWAATHLEEEARVAGASAVTSSGTTLLTALMKVGANDF